MAAKKKAKKGKKKATKKGKKRAQFFLLLKHPATAGFFSFYANI